MNREAKQEIRRVLMGRTLIAEDGRLIAMEKGQLRMPMGISDGAGAACFFGIRKKARRLKASCPEQKARNIAASLMQDVGRALYLPQQPEAIACANDYMANGLLSLTIRTGSRSCPPGPDAVSRAGSLSGAP